MNVSWMTMSSVAANHYDNVDFHDDQTKMKPKTSIH